MPKRLTSSKRNPALKPKVRRPFRKRPAARVRQRPLQRGFIITPGGPRPTSLVQVIKPGERIIRSGGVCRKVKLTDNTVTNPPLRPKARANLPSFGGWITSSFWINSSQPTISSFSSTWMVPKAPTTDSGQLIYLFNGLEDINSECILQPVLQWGESPDGGGSYWAVASWFVNKQTGAAFRTPLVNVSEGQVLTGVMTLLGPADQGFRYSCEFQGIPGTSLEGGVQAPELSKAVEVLECHRMTACTDYPATPMTVFGSIQIQTGGNSLTPTWVKNDQITGCGEHTQILNNGAANVEVDIYYGITNQGLS
jgi:hypothetical protein